MLRLTALICGILAITVTNVHALECPGIPSTVDHTREISLKGSISRFIRLLPTFGVTAEFKHEVATILKDNNDIADVIFLNAVISISCQLLDEDNDMSSEEKIEKISQVFRSFKPRLSLTRNAGVYEIIAITRPSDGDVVEWQPIVEGKATASSSSVWVVVRPYEQREYWVQPPGVVDGEGKWSVQVYIGNKNDYGMRAQIRAVSDPVKDLEEGDMFLTWPSGKWKSEIVNVTRQQEQ